jgi:hypothetical protein
VCFKWKVYKTAYSELILIKKETYKGSIITALGSLRQEDPQFEAIW